MYCNYPVTLSSGVVVVVTELDHTPERNSPVSIRAGYAIDRKGNDLPFKNFIDRDFVNKLLTECDV